MPANFSVGRPSVLCFSLQLKRQRPFQTSWKAEKIHQNPPQSRHKIHIFKCFSQIFLPRDRSAALVWILRSFSLKNEAKISKSRLSLKEEAKDKGRKIPSPTFDQLRMRRVPRDGLITTWHTGKFQIQQLKKCWKCERMHFYFHSVEV